MSKMHFLLTGYGSIGSLVVANLLKQKPDCKITIIDKDEKAIHSALIRYKNNKDIKPLVCDIAVKSDLQRLFAGHKPPTHIIHTAAMKHVTFCEDSPLLATVNNIIGINNLLEICYLNSVQKFVNVSTDKSSSPSNVMGATKFIAERSVIAYNKLSTLSYYQSVRLGNVLGSNGSLIPTIVSIVDKNQDLDLTDLEATRFFIGPNEVAEFIVDATLTHWDGDILIKKLKSATLEVMVKSVLSLIGKPDYEFQIHGLRQGEKLHEYLFTDSECHNIKDRGDAWMINYKHSFDPVEVVDSSQCCVDQEEFMEILTKMELL